MVAFEITLSKFSFVISFSRPRKRQSTTKEGRCGYFCRNAKIMLSDASTSTTCFACAAIFAVSVPSPQPTSRIASREIRFPSNLVEYDLIKCERVVSTRRLRIKPCLDRICHSWHKWGHGLTVRLSRPDVPRLRVAFSLTHDIKLGMNLCTLLVNYSMQPMWRKYESWIKVGDKCHVPKKVRAAQTHKWQTRIY